MSVPFHHARRAAFTLVELVITAGVAAVAGLVIFLVFYQGLNLFAKNTAINYANRESQQVLQDLQGDLHQAVSTPFFLSSTATAVSTLPVITVNSVAYNGANVTTASEGVSFQVFGGKPSENFEIGRNASSGATQVVITGSTAIPVAGQRLIIPAYQYEADITAVSTSGTAGTTTALHTLTLSTILSAANSSGSSSLPGAITACSASNTTSTVYASGVTDYHIICYLTNRVCYLAVPVSGTSPQAYELRYYPCYNATYNTKYYSYTSNLFTAKPFQLATVNNATNTQYVSVTMAIQDTKTSNRGYKVTNLYFTTNTPYRNAVTNYQ